MGGAWQAEIENKRKNRGIIVIVSEDGDEAAKKKGDGANIRQA